MLKFYFLLIFSVLAIFPQAAWAQCPTNANTQFSVTDETCFSAKDGTMDIVFNDGTAPYQIALLFDVQSLNFYLPSVDFTVNKISPNHFQLTGLPPGIFIVRVNCSDGVNAVNLGDPAPEGSTHVHAAPEVLRPDAQAATNIGCNEFDANWDASNNATGYRLDVATDINFTSILPAYNDLDVGTATTYSITGLIEGTDYFYRVRAIRNACPSSLSSDTIATATAPLPVLQDLTKTGADQSCEGSDYFVPLNGSELNVTYEIYVDGNPSGITAAGDGNPISLGPINSLVSGSTYNLTVNAKTGVGCSQLMNGSIDLTINPIPATPVATNDGPKCEGEDIQLSTPAVAGATYSWTGPNGFTSNIQEPVITAATPAQAGSYAVTVTLLGCPSLPGTTDVVVNPLPVVNNQAPEVCEDVQGSGQAAVDLTNLNTAIDGGAGSTITWYADAGPTNPVADPTNVTASNGDDFYALVDNGTCTNVAKATYTVNSQPVANDQTPAACEDVAGSGKATVDLTVLNAAIDGGAGNTITWYTDAGLTNPIADPTNVTANNGDDFYAKVDNGACTNSAMVKYTINPVPTANGQTPSVCEDVPGSGQAVVDLTTLNAAIDGGAGGMVTWYADAGPANPVADPTTVTVSNGDDFYAEVSDGTCTNVATVKYVINPDPVITNQTPTLCEDVAGSGQAVVDLTALNTAIDGGAGTTITWYTDAGLATPVADPTNVTAGNGDVYYAKVDNGTCTNVATATYTIKSQPVANGQNPSVCEDVPGSGKAVVDLTTLNAAIDGGAGSTITWYADAGLTTPVADPTNVTVSNSDDFYAETSNGACTNVATVKYTINPAPVANDQNPAVCEDVPGSGKATVDLTALNTAIDGGAGTITWYADASLATPVADPTNVTANNGDDFYAEVSDGTCTNVATVKYTINPAPTVTDQTPSVCEGVAGSGQAAVDLTMLNAAIDGGAGTTITWYADAGPANPVADPTNVTISNGDDFYALVDNGTCTNVAKATYTVNSQPVANGQTPAVCEDVAGSGKATVDLTTLNSAIDGGTGNTITWYADAGLTAPVADPTNVTANNGDDFYAKVDNGACTNSAMVKYTINPVADPTIAPVGSLCINDAAVTLSAATNGGSWIIDGSAATNSFDPAVAGVGNHQVVYTVSLGSCVSSDTINILVGNPPDASINAAGPFCDSDAPVNLTAATPGGTWSGNGITDATNGTFDPSQANIGNNTITYNVSVGSCSDIATKTIVVNNGPTLTITDPAPVCSANTVDITDASVTAGSDAGTLSYWKDASASLVLSNPNAIAVSGTYYIRLDNGVACAPIKPVNVVINPAPVTSAINGNATPDCGSAGITYSVTNTPGSIYTWTVPNGATIVSGQGSNSITVDFADKNGFVTVMEETASGCTGGTVSLGISLQNCGFSVDFTADVTTICLNEPVTFTDLSTGLTGGAIYTWDFGTGASPANANTAGPHVVAYTTPGLKTVSLQITDGANNGTETKTNYINVVDLPTASISGNATICPGTSAPLTITATGTGPWNVDYSDGVNTFNISFNSSPFVLNVNPTATTTYSLVSVADANCSGPASGSATVTVTPARDVTIQLDNVSVLPGQMVNLPVRVKDFVNFNRTYFTVSWNPAQLTFGSVENNVLGQGVFDASQANSGKLTFSWQATSALDTTILDNTAIFEIKFTAASLNCNDAAVTIDQAPAALLPLEVGDENGCVANVTVIDGSVHTFPLPPTAAADTVFACVDAPGPALTVTPDATAGTTVNWYSDKAGANLLASGNSFNPTIATSIAKDTTFYFNQDVPGCGISALDSMTISIIPPPQNPVLSSSDPDNAICAGEQVIFTASPGGLANYKFYLNGALAQDGASNIFVKNDLADQDSVSVTVANKSSCSTDVDGIVTSVIKLVVDYTVSNITACGASDGAININKVTGGIGPYSFNWTGPSITDPTQADQTNLGRGFYTLEVFDAGSGCSDIVNIELKEPVNFTISSTQTNVSTPGGSDGSISLAMTGGSGNYSISWTGPNGFTASGAAISNLIAGDYQATVTDNVSGCTDGLIITVSQPTSGLVLSNTKTDVTTCGADDGSIDLTIKGGSGNYAISWVGPNSYTSNDEDIAGLTEGLYIVTVQDNVSLITAQWTVQINAPLSFSINMTVTDMAICSVEDGAVKTNITGGSGNFTYLWKGINGTTFSATTKDIGNLGAGSYRIIVKDNVSGCVDSMDATVTKPVICDQPCGLYVESSINNVSCPGDSNGVAIITVISGGSGDGNYYVSIDTGKTFMPFQGFDVTAIDDREQGSYLFIVKDTVTACQDTTVAHVGVQTDLAVNINVTDAGCSLNDGIITINASGGVPPVSAKIVDHDGFATVMNGSGYFQFKNLVPGKYYYEVTEKSGCTMQATDSIEVSSNCSGGCTSLTASARGFVDATCATQPNGQATIDVIGGASPYEYSVDGVHWTKFISGNPIKTLPPDGTYNIAIRQDSINGGCRTQVQVTIGGPPPIVLQDPIITIQQASCNQNDGSVQIGQATGGATPYNYKIDGDYIQMPADFVVGGLRAGMHTYSVVDKSNCQADFDFSVTSPGAIIAKAEEVPVSCSSIFLKAGIRVTIDLAATQVPGPYEFTISPENKPGEDSTFQMPDSGLRTVLQLNKGFYDVTVKSTTSSGCTYNQTVGLFKGASPVDFSIINYDSIINCFGGQSAVTIGNVIGDYDTTFIVHLIPVDDNKPIYTHSYHYYEVENGLTIDESNLNNDDFVAGTYYIKLIQNQDGCPGVESVSPPFTVYEPAGQLGLEVTNSGVSLPDQPTGFIEGQITPSGGAPYQVLAQLKEPAFEMNVADIIAFNEAQQWITATNSGNNLNLYTVKLDSLWPGKYEINVRDSYGCEQVVEFEVGYDESIFIPNVFTPNNDGYNDKFYIRNLPESGTKVIIANRLGSVVFRSDDYNFNTLWDGGSEPDGIYFYNIKMPDEQTFKGWVQIWRGVKP